MEYARYEEPESQSGGSSAAEGRAALVWLLIGVGVGAGAALLLAPAAGRELRGVLFRRWRSALNGISRGTQKLRNRGSNLINFRRPRMG